MNTFMLENTGDIFAHKTLYFHHDIKLLSLDPEITIVEINPKDIKYLIKDEHILIVQYLGVKESTVFLNYLEQDLKNYKKAEFHHVFGPDCDFAITQILTSFPDFQFSQVQITRAIGNGGKVKYTMLS